MILPSRADGKLFFRRPVAVQILISVSGVRLLGDGRRQPQHSVRHMPILGGDGRVCSRRRDNSCWQSVLRRTLLGGQAVSERAGDGATKTVSRALERQYVCGRNVAIDRVISL